MARPTTKSTRQLAEHIAEAIESFGFFSDPGTQRETRDLKRDEKMRRFPEKTYRNNEVHRLDDHFVCRTENRGHATPNGQSMTDIVLDASEGFIPLWEYGVTLRWCFDEVALNMQDDPEEIRKATRGLVQQAAMAWGDAAPIKFSEERDSYDFKITVHNQDRCSTSGCTLARAFFPDSGRHELEIYPKMFTQSKKEQLDTLTHEMGHIFGLRHFFADVKEAAFPSVIFGKHDKFSIMNYGILSELTDDDRNDLKRLYQGVWSGAITNINGTPIRLFRPFHESGALVTPKFSFDGSWAH